MGEGNLQKGCAWAGCSFMARSFLFFLGGGRLQALLGSPPKNCPTAVDYPLTAFGYRPTAVGNRRNVTECMSTHFACFVSSRERSAPEREWGRTDRMCGLVGGAHLPPPLLKKMMPSLCLPPYNMPLSLLLPKAYTFPCAPFAPPSVRVPTPAACLFLPPHRIRCCVAQLSCT